MARWVPIKDDDDDVSHTEASGGGVRRASEINSPRVRIRSLFITQRSPPTPSAVSISMPKKGKKKEEEEKHRSVSPESPSFFTVNTSARVVNLYSIWSAFGFGWKVIE